MFSSHIALLKVLVLTAFLSNHLAVPFLIFFPKSSYKVINKSIKISLFIMLSSFNTGFPGGTSVKELSCQCRRCKRPGFDLCIGKIPWRSAWLHGESHEHRSLVGYDPSGHKESDMTGHISCTHT